MIDKFIAFDKKELTNKLTLIKANQIYKSKLINEQQYTEIKEAYPSILYTPSVFMKALLFLVSIVALTTIISPFALAFGVLGNNIDLKHLFVILGISIIVFTELILIKRKSHYKSGITEAGIFIGFAFTAFGILEYFPPQQVIYPSVGLFFSLFASIRYLNRMATFLSLIFLGWIILELFNEFDGSIKGLLPFALMFVYGFIYLNIQKLNDKQWANLYEEQLFIIKFVTLVSFYLAGNYFIVREASSYLMGIKTNASSEIPLSFILYLHTAICPFVILLWGIYKRSIITIRVGLLTTALSVLTFKYYFSFGLPVLTITIGGGILTGLTFYLLNFLKIPRRGYTRERLVQLRSDNSNLSAFIFSQIFTKTQGGEIPNNETPFNGGKFGGAGSGSDW